MAYIRRAAYSSGDHRHRHMSGSDANPSNHCSAPRCKSSAEQRVAWNVIIYITPAHAIEMRIPRVGAPVPSAQFTKP